MCYYVSAYFNNGLGGKKSPQILLGFNHLLASKLQGEHLKN